MRSGFNQGEDMPKASDSAVETTRMADLKHGTGNRGLWAVDFLARVVTQSQRQLEPNCNLTSEPVHLTREEQQGLNLIFLTG